VYKFAVPSQFLFLSVLCSLERVFSVFSDGEGHEGHSHDLPPHFEDEQLAFMIDPVLRKDDVNNDGLIDYAEFIAAQIRNKMDAKAGVKASSR